MTQLQNAPDTADTCREEGWSEMLRRMYLIRYFDAACSRLAEQGEIVGAIHLTTGQEGEVVGACMALDAGDLMTGNHRSHGHPIAMGADVRGLMAEILGRATGVCGGKGGSMHLADYSVGAIGECGIVGSAIPIATGAALSSQVKGLSRVCLCFFGDGAANEGTFHESLNLASIWRLPVVYFCENNLYAVSVPMSKSTSVKHVADRAAAYSMPGIVVDGQDAIRVYEVVRAAVARARSGGGPTLIEAKTYRYVEHGKTRRAKRYRPEAEEEQWRERDPIALLTRRLEAAGVGGDHLHRIEEAARVEIDEAVTFALASPYPLPEALWDGLYADPARARGV